MAHPQRPIICGPWERVVIPFDFFRGIAVPVIWAVVQKAIRQGCQTLRLCAVGRQTQRQGD